MSDLKHNSAGAWAKKFFLATRAALEASLRPYDIGSTQWYVLWHLVHDGPTAQRLLLAHLQIEKPTLSGVVAALVRKGLVAQALDSQDKRQKLLSITPAGRTLWKKLPDPISDMRKIAFEGVSEGDLATVVRVLSSSTERLNQFLQSQKGKKS